MIGNRRCCARGGRAYLPRGFYFPFRQFLPTRLPCRRAAVLNSITVRARGECGIRTVLGGLFRPRTPTSLRGVPHGSDGAGIATLDVGRQLTTLRARDCGLSYSRAGGTASPRHKPVEVIDKLNKEINAGLADPKMKVRLAELGGTVLAGSPADFGKLIAEETEKWGKVIRAANIKAD
jgi:Tripartite tricarboxylate transporter family receptor